MQTRVRARADRALGRDREVGCILGHAATTQHCDAVEDNRVPQEIQKFTSGICAVGRAVIVYDQRAVAVINFQAAVRTTAHTAVGTSWHPRKAVLPRRVADPLGIRRQPAYGPPSEAVASSQDRTFHTSLRVTALVAGLIGLSGTVLFLQRHYWLGHGGMERVAAWPL
jgi:hypothetical protein